MCVCSVLQSYLTLWDPMECSLQGSSVHGIFQARVLEQDAISYSRDLLDPGIKRMSPESIALVGRFFTTEAPGKPLLQLHSMKITSIDFLRLKSTPQIQCNKLDLKDRNSESWTTSHMANFSFLLKIITDLTFFP